jgi:group I intron endonuclease
MIGIYAIKNKINNKMYIGKGVSIEGRWASHKTGLRKNSHGNDYLQKAWNKYGEENFDFVVLEITDRESLSDREISLIFQHKTANRDFGYNISLGGDGGLHSEETKRKISIGNKGKKLSIEHRSKLSRVKSEAEKEKISKTKKEKNKGKISENFFWYGRNHSEESKKKISQSKKGTKLSNKQIEAIRAASTGRQHSKESIELMTKQKLKLSDEQVFEVINLITNKANPQEIGRQFGVSDKTIIRIANNTTYTHLKRDKMYDKYKRGEWI